MPGTPTPGGAAPAPKYTPPTRAPHTHPRRRGRRTDIQPPDRRRVHQPRRPQEQLRDVADAGADVAADQVRVVPLDVRRTHHRPREDTLAEPGREPFDLRLDARHHV